MRRRELLLFAVGAMTANRGLRAQQKALPVIGFLANGAPGPNAPFAASFRRGLNEAGYIEGKNVAIEYRWSEGHYDRMPALAVDLVDLKVDVIAAAGTSGIKAAKRATSTIPILFFGGGDLVAAGLVTNLARPGGNLTELNPKRLELLSELVPQARMIALLVNPDQLGIANNKDFQVPR